MTEERPSLMYFEDLWEGRQFESGSVRMESEAIKDFARQYDPQPFHTDEVAAQHSLFQGLAASGWHTAAVTMRLMVESLPVAGGLIGAGGELVWPRPTRPGDVLRARITIVESQPSQSRPDRGKASVRVETVNQREEIVQVMTARIVVARRAAAQAGTTSPPPAAPVSPGK